MRFTQNKLSELVTALTIHPYNNDINNKELSGYITEGGHYRVFVGNKDYAPWFDKRISFHTHVNDTNYFSSQDAVVMMNARKTKIHVLVTKNKVIVLKKVRRMKPMLVLGAVGYCFIPEDMWKTQWKASFKLMGYDIIEYDKKEFVA